MPVTRPLSRQLAKRYGRYPRGALLRASLTSRWYLLACRSRVARCRAPRDRLPRPIPLPICRDVRARREACFRRRSFSQQFSARINSSSPVVRRRLISLTSRAPAAVFGGFDEAPILLGSNYTGAVQNYGIRSRPSSGSVGPAKRTTGHGDQNYRVACFSCPAADGLGGKSRRRAKFCVERLLHTGAGSLLNLCHRHQSPSQAAARIGRVMCTGKRNSPGGLDFATRSFLTATATPPGEIRE